MPKKSKETDEKNRFETKKKTSSKGMTIVILLVLVLTAVVAGVVTKSMSQKTQPISQSETADDEGQKPEEAFDLTTNEGKVNYVDQMMSGVMVSDVYANGNWLARKHYVYTELLALEEAALINAIHYDTPTRAFSIEHVDGSVRWYPISDKEK